MSEVRNHGGDCEVGCCSEDDADCTCGAYQANQAAVHVDTGTVVNWPKYGDLRTVAPPATPSPTHVSEGTQT